MKILGVDPGASGALVMLETKDNVLCIQDMPVVRVQRTTASRNKTVVAEGFLASLVHKWSPDVAWVERVHAMPKQGVVSSFNFGLAFGLVLGVLAGAKVPVALITPTEWKREFRIGADKQAARLLVSRMFPSYASFFSRVKDDGRAEAALLSVYGSKYPL